MLRHRMSEMQSALKSATCTTLLAAGFLATLGLEVLQGPAARTGSVARVRVAVRRQTNPNKRETQGISLRIVPSVVVHLACGLRSHTASPTPRLSQIVSAEELPPYNCP